MMTKKGSELPNPIFSSENIIQLRFLFLSWKQMSFSILTKFCFFLFRLHFSVRMKKLCCYTCFGIKVINFFSASASDRLRRILLSSAFCDEKTKLLFCKQTLFLLGTDSLRCFVIITQTSLFLSKN